MSLRSAKHFVAPLLAIALTAGALTAVAQTKKSTSSKSKSTTAKKESSPYHRLPPYYGQLKLKPEQKQEIYAIKDKFGPEIAKYEKALEDLKAEQNEEIKDVLTRTQVTALNKLLSGSSSWKSSSSKSSSSKKNTTSSSSKKK